MPVGNTKIQHRYVQDRVAKMDEKVTVLPELLNLTVNAEKYSDEHNTI